MWSLGCRLWPAQWYQLPLTQADKIMMIWLARDGGVPAGGKGPPPISTWEAGEGPLGSVP